jgi:hypothetical protein
MNDVTELFKNEETNPLPPKLEVNGLSNEKLRKNSVFRQRIGGASQMKPP